MKRTLQILFWLVPAMATIAHAQIYMCKDAQGKVYTSDRPIPECSDRAVREYRNNGVLKRETPAPLTPQQKRQAQLEEEQKAREEAARREQKQADLALMARFRTEDDIAAARRRALELVEDQRKRHAHAMAAAEKQYGDAQKELARLPNKKDASVSLTQRLEEAERVMQQERKKQQDIDAETIRINERFDAKLKRFRELSSAQVTAAK